MQYQKTLFENWWLNEGSKGPQVDEDLEEFTKRMCQNAWAIGAAMQEQAAPVVKESLTTQAIKLALERIADPRNTHFAGDAQVVAREALALAKQEQGEPVNEGRALKLAMAEENDKRLEQEQGEPVGDLAEYVIGCFRAAEAEGLQEALTETTDERLKDLVERRLMHAFYKAQESQQRKPLTDEQIEAQKADWFQRCLKPEIIFRRGIRAAEAAHGIKE